MTYLAGKTILITGASRGIGAATARVCHAADAKVIAHASGMSDAAASVSGDLGVDFLFEDLSEAGAGDKLFAKALDASGGQIDGVVNNA